MFTLDNLFLLLTGLTAIYLLWRFYTRWSKQKKLYDLYYGMGFLVLLISGLLLIFLGLDILKSPYVLTVASLIPLGISMGIVEEYYPQYKTPYKWFALVGFLAIAISAIAGLEYPQENLSPGIPWSSRVGHLPGSILCQECS